MQSNNAPGKIVLPFATAGAKNDIPVPSQIGITPGAASYTDGFPPATMTPVSAGGVPPSGQDFNGVFHTTTALLRWYAAGGGFVYDDEFAADPNVGGYPKGARVMRSDGMGYWLNTVDNNSTDPESSGAVAAGWVPSQTTGIATITMSNANVILTPVQYGMPVIVVTGALTADLNLIFPDIVGEWIAINKCTGSFDIIAKTSSGTGVTLSSGSSQIIWGDGDNIYFAQTQGPDADLLYAPLDGGEVMKGSLFRIDGRDLQDRPLPPLDTDWNTIVESGVYIFRNDRPEETLNDPTHAAGLLEVHRSQDGSYIFQRFHSYYGDRIYHRRFHKNLNNWSAWVDVYTSNNPPPAPALDDDLDAIANLATSGIIVRRGEGDMVTRSLTSSTLALSHFSGIDGNPQIELQNLHGVTNSVGSSDLIPVIEFDEYGRMSGLNSVQVAMPAQPAYPEVGCYALMVSKTGDSYGPNATVPGSLLAPASCAGDVNETAVNIGTWRIHGRVYGGAGNNDKTSLWVRIA